MKMEKDVAGNGRHWFISEELKWRSVASAVWTWCMTFPVLGAFIILFSLHPMRHIFIIYDVVNTISTIKAWFLCTLMAFFTALLVRLHVLYYQVLPVHPITRLQFIAKALNPSRLFHNFSCGVYGGAVAHLVTYLVPGRYSFSYHQCSYNTEDGKINQFCLNESWFIMVFFGFIMGIVHSAHYFLNQKNTLSYLHVQEARFLYIKCKLPCLISSCAKRSFSILRHFFIIYYLFGFVARDAAAFLIGVMPSEQHLLSIWRIFHAVPVLWNLWLLGTLFLLIWEISWQLFNIYNTQNYPFLLDSVFPEDTPKLLIENLRESNPLAVQYMAYQCLSIIAKAHPVKRQQIFALSHQAENGRPIWWNKVADCCLSRIRQFTEELGDHQLRISSYADGHDHSRKSASSTSLNKSDDSKSEPSPASVSVYRRRPVGTFQTSAYADVTNISCFNMSSLDATHIASTTSAHTTLNSSNIAVPTPRLWTRTENTLNDGNSSVFSGKEGGMKSQDKMMRSRFQNFVTNMKSLRVISYFITVIPSCTLLNLFREQMLHKWAMQSLSYLCAASIAEDKYGVVQTRLHEVIGALADLLGALEKLGKVSGTSAYIHRLRAGLVQETKASLHRIADAYGDSLKSVHLAPEHRRRMESLAIYSE